MKKRVWGLWIALCAALLLIPAALGTDVAPEDIAPVVTIANQSVTEGTCAFTAELSGAEQTGTLLVCVYSQQGILKQFSQYNADASISVQLTDVAETDAVRTLWTTADYAPIAAADVVRTRSLTAQSYEEFAEMAAEMLQSRKYSDISAESVAESDDEYLFARLIVKSAAPLPDLTAFHVAQSIQDMEGHTILQFDRSEDARDCSEFLKTRISSDGYVEPDTPAVLDPEGESGSAENDGADIGSSSAYSWGVPIIHADAYAENLVKRGKTTTVTVAVVDTGVDYNHSFLKARMVSGYDYVDNDSDPMDEHYHGTHVAGTVVDCTPGLNVKIMPVRVLNASGSGTSLGVSLGIRYAAEQGADVINMSLGGGHNAYKDEAVDYAVSKNVVVVVAAGNSNQDAKNFCPAHIEKCITVAAVDSNSKPASFSNYGSCVDLAAPGVGIKSASPKGGTRTLDGTSMASPHAAGCAALLLCDFPHLTPEQVESRLVNAVRKPAGWNTKYGAGIVDMERFIQDTPDPVPAEKLYAVLYTSGELSFQSNLTPQSGKTILKTYETNGGGYTEGVYAAWYPERSQITSVSFAVPVYPTSTALWFFQCENLSSVKNMENLHTDFVTDMSQMFSYCTHLALLNLTGFDTANLTNTTGMFYRCSSLATIYASASFTSGRITDSARMFEGCTALRGGSGTTYSPSHIDKAYARIDQTSAPGYFTAR